MLDKLTQMWLEHQAETMPSSAQNILWRQVWDMAQGKLRIDLHTLLPKERLYEIDDLTLAILQSAGVVASRIYDDKSYRQFKINGQTVVYSDQIGGWIQH